jgi:hypothetical protein
VEGIVVVSAKRGVFVQQERVFGEHPLRSAVMSFRSFLQIGRGLPSDDPGGLSSRRSHRDDPLLAAPIRAKRRWRGGAAT